MIKRILLLFTLLALLPSTLAYAQRGGRGGSVYVHGYTRSNGTYVAPHYRSAPDGNFYNNWSTKGNFNPYTGKEGTKLAPSYSLPSSSSREVVFSLPPISRSSVFYSSESSVTTKSPVPTPERNIERSGPRHRTPIFISDGTFQYQSPRPETSVTPSDLPIGISVSDEREETVYITRTGAKYHRDGCQYLSRSKIPIKKSNAVARGYEPCKVCRP